MLLPFSYKILIDLGNKKYLTIWTKYGHNGIQTSWDKRCLDGESLKNGSRYLNSDKS